jgi:hypothetical protein
MHSQAVSDLSLQLIQIIAGFDSLRIDIGERIRPSNKSIIIRHYLIYLRNLLSFHQALNSRYQKVVEFFGSVFHVAKINGVNP